MIETWEADGLRLAVDVAFDEAASIADLSGASAVAVAGRKGRGPVLSGSTAVSAETITVTFAAGSLTPGIWRLQVRVTAGGETQTVLDEELRVLPSLA